MAALCAALVPAEAAFDSATNTYSGTDNAGIDLTSTPDSSQVLIFDMGGSGRNYFSDANTTYAGAIQIGGSTEGGGLRITDGYGKTTTFSKTVTGSGILSKTGNGANNAIRFTGDATAYTGEIQLGSTASFTLGFGSGEAAPEKATTEHGVSGTGTITFSTNANTLEYNYGSGSGSVYVTNAIERTAGTSQVTLSGAAAMEFMESVTIDTLKFSNTSAKAIFHKGTLGTVTGTGAGLVKTGSGALAIGDLGNNTLTLNEGSITGTLTNGTLATGTGGSLENFTLDGGTINFGNATETGTLSATGTLTLTSGNLKVGNLDSLAVGSTYTLLTASPLGTSVDFNGVALNDMMIDSDGYIYQMTDAGDVKYQLSTQGASGALTLTNAGAFESQTLTWKGGSGTWQAGQGGWVNSTGTDANYASGDTVIFGGNSSPETLTIENALIAKSITVSKGTYVFTGAGSMSTNSLILGNGTDAAQLTIENANKVWNGTVDLQTNGTLTLGHANALGSSNITFNGGMLKYGDGVTTDISAQLHAGTGDVKVDIGGNRVAWAKTPTGNLVLSGKDTGKLTLNNTTGGTGPANLTVNSGAVVLTSGASLKTEGNYIQTVIHMAGGSLLISGSNSAGANLYASAVSTWTFMFAQTLQLTPEKGNTITIGAEAGTGRGIGFSSSNALTYDGSQGGGTATISANITAWGNTAAVERKFDISDSAHTGVEVDVTGRLGESGRGNDGQSVTLVKQGDGTLQISGANHTPGLRIEKGTVIANNAQALGKDRTLKNTVTVGSVAGQTATLDLRVSNATGITQLLGNANGVITNTGTAESVLKIGNATAASRLDSTFDGTITGDKLGVELVAGNKLALSGANTYKGSTVVGEGAELSLKGSGSIDNGKAKIAAKTNGTDAVLSNATVTTGGISRTTGTEDTEQATVSNALVTVTQAESAFSLENVNFSNSLVDLSKAGSVTLSNVTFSGDSKIALTLGKEAGVTTSASENLTHTFAGTDKTAQASVTKTLTLDLTGIANAQLVLDLNNSLLCSADLAGKHSVMIWLEGLTLTEPSTQLTLADHLKNGLKVDGASVAIDSYTAGSGAAGTSGTVVYVDFTPAVMPEPTTATLGLLGLSALLLRRRRRA